MLDCILWLDLSGIMQTQSQFWLTFYKAGYLYSNCFVALDSFKNGDGENIGQIFAMNFMLWNVFLILEKNEAISHKVIL